jgi:signal transduction histidine kinase
VDRPRALVIGSEAGRRLIEQMLGEDFDVVTAAADGLAARDSLPVDGIDLVVLDAGVSRSGDPDIGVIRAREELAGVPILVVSDPDQDALSARLLREGVQDRVRMPVSAEELRGRARTLVAIKRARDVLGADVANPDRDLESLARRVVAEKRLAEDACRKAEASSRAKDDFLAVLAHELRTPLNAVLGWTRLLRREGVAEGDLKRGLEVIDRNARVQARLIEDVLEVSAMILRKVQVRLDPIAFGPVLSEALDAVRPAAEAKGIDLRCERAVRDLMVLGDAERLLQVLHNLLGNAVKFTPDGGAVTVRMCVAEGAVVLEVEDTGIGIAPDLLPHIFDQFTQGAGRAPDRSRGLGLGLAIAHHLIELHGGGIEAASPGEGRGTTFTVRLPVLKSPQPVPAEHAR